MTMTTREAFERGTDTFNARDLDGFAEVLADDVVFVAPGGMRGQGKQACVEFFGSWHKAFPDAHVEVHNVHFTDDIAVEEGTFTGTVARSEAVPILIAGAGPAGLTLSLLLARFGVESMIVERRLGLSVLPRATGVNLRSMEIYRSLGLGDAIDAVSMPGDVPLVLVGETLAAPLQETVASNHWGPSADPAWPSPSHANWCAQDRLEGVLLETLRRSLARGCASATSSCRSGRRRAASPPSRAITGAARGERSAPGISSAPTEPTAVSAAGWGSRCAARAHCPAT